MFTFKHKFELTNEELALLMYNFCGTIAHKEMRQVISSDQEVNEIHAKLVERLQGMWVRSKPKAKTAETKDIWDAVKSVCGR